ASTTPSAGGGLWREANDLLRPVEPRHGVRSRRTPARTSIFRRSPAQFPSLASCGTTMTRLHFLRGRILAAPPRGLAALFCMALAVALPTLARAGIDSWVAGTTFVAYYPFVLLSAIVLGWRRALVVTLLSAAVANFLFMSPRFTFFAGSGDTAGAVSFVFSSLLIVLLTETLRRNVAEVEASRSLEARLNRELQ